MRIEWLITGLWAAVLVLGLSFVLRSWQILVNKRLEAINRLGKRWLSHAIEIAPIFGLIWLVNGMLLIAGMALVWGLALPPARWVPVVLAAQLFFYFLMETVLYVHKRRRAR